MPEKIDTDGLASCKAAMKKPGSLTITTAILDTSLEADVDATGLLAADTCQLRWTDREALLLWEVSGRGPSVDANRQIRSVRRLQPQPSDRRSTCQ